MGNVPRIGAVPEGVQRPFWSVMIPTYNPVPGYLEQTLNSVLQQHPGPQEMQIELIDDGSTDFDPEVFLWRMGAPAVSFYRQPRHVGIGGNWNTCLDRARGQWVHLFHQDDLVLPGFYRRLREGVKTDPRIGAAFCQHFMVDGKGSRRFLMSRLKQETPGIVADWLEYVFVGLSFQTPSIVVKRSVYEEVGGFDVTFEYALDWDMWKRIAPRYPLWFEPEPLACYRRHERATTRGLMRSGRNIAEIRRSIEVSQSYLPPAIAAEVLERARKFYTKHAVCVARQLLFTEHDVRATIGQLWEARKMSSSTMVVKAIVKLAMKTWQARRRM